MKNEIYLTNFLLGNGLSKGEQYLKDIREKIYPHVSSVEFLFSVVCNNLSYTEEERELIKKNKKEVEKEEQSLYEIHPLDSESFFDIDLINESSSELLSEEIIKNVFKHYMVEKVYVSISPKEKTSVMRKLSYVELISERRKLFFNANNQVDFLGFKNSDDIFNNFEVKENASNEYIVLKLKLIKN
jgi:hypothetical protein